MPVTRHTTPVSSIKEEVRKERPTKSSHTTETLQSKEVGREIKSARVERSEMEQLLEKISSLQVTQRGNNGGHAMPSYKKNESFSTFIRKVNDYLNYIGADESYAIRTLPIMLAGYARDAYDKVDQELKSKGPWVSLLDALQREIYSEDRILLAQAELASVKQNTAKVEIFAKTCKELAERAYPFDEKAREAFLLATFINGLNSKLRTATRRAKPSSFESAVNAASHEEVILRVSEEGYSSAIVMYIFNLPCVSNPAVYIRAARGGVKGEMRVY